MRKVKFIKDGDLLHEDKPCKYCTQFVDQNQYNTTNPEEMKQVLEQSRQGVLLLFMVHINPTGRGKTPVDDEYRTAQTTP